MDKSVYEAKDFKLKMQTLVGMEKINRVNQELDSFCIFRHRSL
jgi:hypothetical protein